MKIDDMTLSDPKKFVLKAILNGISRFSYFSAATKMGGFIVWTTAVNNFGAYSTPEKWISLEFVFIPIILALWFVDANYLRLERVLRHHYDKIATGAIEEKGVFYAFSLSGAHLMRLEPLIKSIFSKTLVTYYLTLMITCLVVITPDARMLLMLP